MRLQFILPLCAALITGCANYPKYTGPFDRIEVGPGPEDLALDTLGQLARILVSCSERRMADESRNGFYAINPVNLNVSRLAMTNFPATIVLHPHGIDVGYMDGLRCLFVVNHEPQRQSVLVFEILGDTLRFVKQLTDPLLISPNDLCTDGQGGIYVSNDSGKLNAKLEKLLAQAKSSVVHFDGTSWKKVAGTIKYANGVGVANGNLYVTGTQEKDVLRYAVAQNGELSGPVRIRAPKGSDNIMFANGHLYSTAHLDFFAFIKHVSKPDHPSPGLAYRLNTSTGHIDTLFIDNGTTISAVSTALAYNGHLYLAQVFNPFVLRIALN